MDRPLRIVFAGTPDFAASSLAALIAHKYSLVGVYTQPDRPAGRGQKLKPGPVKQLALEHQIPVFQPLNFTSDDSIAELQGLKADLMVVAAYGLLLPRAVLETPKLGCINVHASLLPRWRGAAPIHRALLEGDCETGITIMQMALGLDTGDMLYKKSTPILAEDTAGTLHDRLAQLGAEALIECLPLLLTGQLIAEKQDDSLSCYADKLQKEEGRLNWSMPAKDLAQRIRGLNPWPVAYCQLGNKNLRIWLAQALENKVEQPVSPSSPGTLIRIEKDGLIVSTGEGELKVLHLQLPGKRAVSVSALLNGQHPFTVGMRFD